MVKVLGVLLSLVPIPFVDLTLREACLLRKLSYLLFRPVRVPLELNKQHLDLILILSRPVLLLLLLLSYYFSWEFKLKTFFVLQLLLVGLRSE